MSSNHFIFVGFELDEAMQVCLDGCGESDKVFFEDPKYLEIIEVDDLRYIGKRLETGLPHDRLEDTARSVVSLLSRVSMGTQLKPSGASIVALEETPPTDQVI